MFDPANVRRVAFVVYDGVQLLDVAGIADAMTLANVEAEAEAYEICYVAAQSSVTTSSSLAIQTIPFSEVRGPFHTFVVPGALTVPLLAALKDSCLIAGIQDLATPAARLVSVCSGAFLLNKAGLLAGRRVATHWLAVADLMRSPNVQVVPDALYVEDGPLWSSAGVAASIDVAIAMITRDLGPDLALRVARRLVIHMARDGTQQQHSELLELQRLGGAALARLTPWIEAQLHRAIRVEEIAEALGVSERSLHRHCLAAFGLSPGRLIAELRMRRAKDLLANPNASVKGVSAQCGFADAAAFSRAFHRRFGESPERVRDASRS